DGTTLARLFRQAVEQIDRIESPEDLENLVDTVLVLEPLEEGRRVVLRSRLIQMLGSLAFDPVNRERIGVGSERVQTGLELRTRIAHLGAYEYIIGVIDRVYHREEGTVTFFQFKTLRLKDRDPKAIAETYRPQMRLYAW